MAGSLVGDLRALTRTLRDNLARPDGRELAQVLMLNISDLHDVAQASGKRSLGAFERAFELARTRDEVGPDDDIEMMSHLIFFGLIYWSVRHERFPSEQESLRMLKIVLAPLANVTL